MENTVITAVRPENEVARLEKLNSFEILDSQPEHPFNPIAVKACQIFNTPVALVSLVDN